MDPAMKHPPDCESCRIMRQIYENVMGVMRARSSLGRLVMRAELAARTGFTVDLLVALLRTAAATGHRVR